MLLFFTVFIDDTLGAYAFHHRLGYTVIGLRPNIDNLVIFFTLGHKTGGKLAFDFTNLIVSTSNNVVLVIWNNKIINANRGTGASREVKPCVHQLVSKDNRIFKANASVALIDNS